MVRTALILGLMGAASAPALAQAEPESAYVRIEDCAQYTLADEPVVESACRGHDDWSVFVHSAEHGAAIAYAHQGGERTGFFGPPGAGQFSHFHTTMEWRRDEAGAFATIHRYISITPVMNDDPDAVETRRDMLMVTALTPQAAIVACPVAYVDASAIASANEAARRLADTVARHQGCTGAAPVTYSTLEAVQAAVQAHLSDAEPADETAQAESQAQPQ